MKMTIESLLKEYISAKLDDSNRQWIGCGISGLIAFYRAIGIDVPVAEDMSDNLIGAYQYHVRKNLNSAWAELCLLDFKAYLHFVFQTGSTSTDLSKNINPDMVAASMNDFGAYEEQRHKS
jgi:hypothetical protein